MTWSTMTPTERIEAITARFRRRRAPLPPLTNATERERKTAYMREWRRRERERKARQRAKMAEWRCQSVK